MKWFEKKWVQTYPKYLLAAIMMTAGVAHFVNPGFFLKIMPPYLPYHLELVYLSGFFEIALSISLLIRPLSRIAAWGIIALLIAVFPANIYLFQNQEIVPASPAAHFVRLILQGNLILWAYCYTGPSVQNSNQVQEPSPDES